MTMLVASSEAQRMQRKARKKTLQMNPDKGTDKIKNESKNNQIKIGNFEQQQK